MLHAEKLGWAWERRYASVLYGGSKLCSFSPQMVSCPPPSYSVCYAYIFDDSHYLTTRLLSSVSTNLLLFQLEPLVNGPFTPDLANPISQLGKNAQEKGWPMDIKVGMLKFSQQCTCVHIVTTYSMSQCSPQTKIQGMMGGHDLSRACSLATPKLWILPIPTCWADMPCVCWGEYCVHICEQLGWVGEIVLPNPS